MNQSRPGSQPDFRRPPLQFNLRTMLAITAALAMVFGVLRWIGAPPQVSVLVLVLLGVSVIAAIGLVVVIAGNMPHAEDEPAESQHTPADDGRREGEGEVGDRS